MSLRRLPKTQRGITLIELMVVVAVVGILALVMGQGFLQLQQSMYAQLDYAEAQQGGRAAVSLLKRYIASSGYGIAAAEQMTGNFPLGACGADPASLGDPPGTAEIFDCDNVDLNHDGVERNSGDAYGAPGVDRLRLTFMRSVDTDDDDLVDGFIDSEVPSANTSPTAVSVSNDGTWPDAALTPNNHHPFEIDDVAIVSGKCVDPAGVSGMDIIKIKGASTSPNASYTFDALASGDSTLACTSASSVYADGYTLGWGTVADIYIDRSRYARPTLRVRLNPFSTTTYVIAHNIDDLQVRYLVDDENYDNVVQTSGEPLTDGYFDRQCDSIPECIDDIESDATLTLTAPYKESKVISRIVGVNLELVARTKTYNSDLDPEGDNGPGTWGAQTGPNWTLQNHTVTSEDDGYRRWIYRAVVKTRNHDMTETTDWATDI